jgi:hypothetical protein
MNRAGAAAYWGAVTVAGRRARCPLCHGCLADVFGLVLPAWPGIKTRALLLMLGTPEEPARAASAGQATTPQNARICVTRAMIALEPTAAQNGG